MVFIADINVDTLINMKNYIYLHIEQGRLHIQIYYNQTPND